MLYEVITPDLPCYTALGGLERIVDIPAVERQIARWPKARLDRVITSYSIHYTKLYDFLFFDRDDLADAMSGIHNEIIRAKLGLFGLGHSVASLQPHLLAHSSESIKHPLV